MATQPITAAELKETVDNFELEFNSAPDVGTMDAIVEACASPVLAQSPWHVVVVKVSNAEEYGALRRAIKEEGIQSIPGITRLKILIPGQTNRVLHTQLPASRFSRLHVLQGDENVVACTIGEPKFMTIGRLRRKIS